VYLKGQTFHSLKAALEYEKLWNTLDLDEDSAILVMNTFQKDVIMNCIMYHCLTNEQFQKMVNDLFFVFLEKLCDHRNTTVPEKHVAD